jgi:hypothetical protein
VTDVPVTPYFFVPAATYRKETGNRITANFTVEQPVPSAALETVALYLHSSIIVDNQYNSVRVTVPLSDVTIGQPLSVSATIPDRLLSGGYLYARVGIKAAGVGEYIYTLPEKVQL